MKKRSLLFVPATTERLISKGLASNADIVIFDLEDAVSFSEKETSRRLLLENLKTASTSSHLFVRVNESRSSFFENDVKIFANLDQVNFVLPKAEGKEDVLYLEKLIHEHGSPKKIMPLIETAKGLWHVLDIVKASKNINVLAFGAEDFSNDIGANSTSAGQELLYARSQLVFLSRVANIEAPIDTVFTDIKNSEGFCEEAEFTKNLGFQGKLLIHPSQVDLSNKIFSPTEKEIMEAEKIVNAFEEAEKEGHGVIEVEGKMVDYPIVMKAKKILNGYQN